MTVQFRTIVRCELCEHRADLPCMALTAEIDQAVSKLRGRMARHGQTLPDAKVVIDCKSFWRLGRKHGNEAA